MFAYSVSPFCPIDDMRDGAVQRLLKSWPQDVRNLLRGTRQNRQHWRGANPAEPDVPRGVLHAACVAVLESNLGDVPRGFIPVDMQDTSVLAQVIYDLACPKEISKHKLQLLADKIRFFMKFAFEPANLPIIRIGYQERMQQMAANAPVDEAPAVESSATQVPVEAPAVELVVEPTVIKPSAPYNGVLGAPLTRSMSDGVFQLQKRNVSMWMNLPPINCEIAEDADAVAVDSYNTELALAKTALAEAQCMGLARYVEMMYRAKQLAVIGLYTTDDTPIDMLHEFDTLKPSHMDDDLFLAAWLVARDGLF